ncbi:coiled-coil and C2 domain-containing protein 1B-like isoform X1 [Nerophis ophidion]|uniref:coiled-coil and C2 domain-containing protein 1B-like isoform X1 n=1 Tax=Nerophis ophidion TaxID=159077 RepID=UPI002AE078D7|nr:coiled-coil and C2 domain-containing protein 1B-like isoform X1 [Nerophis ophidion]XP_061775612.1 coiled-coil and C2 domain-containing protein 1B-like isoform X1 [Nerophis ophidion]
MFGKKRREPLPKGRGASTAKQMGLFLDLDPEGMMMDAEENLDDPDLEAELASLTGGKSAANAEGRARSKGRSPMPMEDIARMADACMRDVDEEEDDDNVEDDEDLLAELQEVVGESEETVCSSAAKPQPSPPSQETNVPAAAPGSLQHTLEERLAMYKMALQNAKAASEGAKARRLERGLKTLETMIGSIKKVRQVNEAQIPPPVATGAPSGATSKPLHLSSAIPSPADQPVESEATTPEIVTAASEEEQNTLASAPEVLMSEPAKPSHPQTEEPLEQQDKSQQVLTMLQERQRQYKMAALRAKKEGDAGQAMLHLKTSKGFDSMIEALKQGQAVDLDSLPPSPPGAGGSSTASVKLNTQVPQPAAAAPAPQAPKDALEALEQRRAKYMESSAEAKTSGEDRKARMYDRIAKQYQSAIRSHKAGKMVNFDELPVPPGFPPIPGQKSTTAEHGLVAALEAASKIASTDDAAASADEDAEEKEKEVEIKQDEEHKKSTLSVPASSQGRRRSPSASPGTPSTRQLSAAAAQQLEFLEGRRKQFMKAALHAKQKNDMEQARVFLRNAKGLEPMIEAARNSQVVDVSTVPSPPGDEDEDFVLVHHCDVNLSEKTEQIYVQLAKILKEQREKCLTHSKQFTHLGNVAETTKFEKMAESCKASLEVLKVSQAKGLPAPTHHFEDVTFHTVRMFPDLSSTEMVVLIVKAMNLPAPSGVQTGDLDAYVKFDFPYPSTEQAQRHKTNVIKNTNCPEYNQSFTLTINRNHRGFRRVVTSKGLKMELLHKGGFLRSDKPIGTAHLRMDKLESHSEIREIVEVMDGRKPTGGRLEVRVQLREPLNGQDMQASTERWLVIDQSQVLL